MNYFAFFILIFFAVNLNANDSLEYFNISTECDRPLGKQITAGALLTFGSVFLIAGYAVNKIGEDIEKETIATGNDQTSSTYDALSFFCYAIGGATISVSIVIQLKTIKKWKLYKKCKKLI